MLPILILKKGGDLRLNHGHLWIFSNEIANFAELKNIEPGSLVAVRNQQGHKFGVGYFNPKNLITARILDLDETTKIDSKFFVNKILTALDFRKKLLHQNIDYCRIIYSEADSLPGLIVDRFNNVFICQVTTFGMENQKQNITDALIECFGEDISILYRNDSELRKIEGLPRYQELAFGKQIDNLNIIENNLDFTINFTFNKENEEKEEKEDGIELKQDNLQKTGWFYDQRLNRKILQELVAKNSKEKDLSVLDCYCYAGGFGINALIGGAKQVTFVDSSKKAIENLNFNLTSHYSQHLASAEVVESQAFDFLESASGKQRTYDIVLLDPPAFVKSRKDFFTGLKGYEKLIKMSCKVLKPASFLVISSCSHHANLDELISSCNNGFRKAGRKARIYRISGADADHPIIPAIKEGEYLKTIWFYVE